MYEFMRAGHVEFYVGRYFGCWVFENDDVEALFQDTRLRWY